MKLITPEISWHQKEPIFSVHFSPKTWKLASGGADSTVKIWMVKEKEDGDDSIGIEFLSNLDRHAKPVNVVRFSPDGNLLASAGDDGTIILWKFNNDNEKCCSEGLEDEVANKESWIVHKMLRGHIEDVYDLSWSPDGTQLISGSVDNSAIIWDAVKGHCQKVITDHKHYVQGVCWDPRNFYVATHSSDRSCRLYATSNHKCLFNIHKNTMSYEKDGQTVKSKCSRMFMDETMQSFFRRCTFSTDGSYLFLPAGLCDGDDKPKKTTYVFARGQYKRPICHLPGSKKATVAVKCSPIVYELIDDKENQLPPKDTNENFKVPYRMVYAVASLDSIIIYDTQHNLPIGYCANMHYASLTDITWSSDGKLLVVSSTDGYCSFIKFEDEELGKPIMYDPIEYQVTQAKIRKKKKKEGKKKDAKKVESEKPDGKSVLEVEKCASPTLADLQREKEKTVSVKAVVDSKQPTIDKLFVTPIRKRKRANDGSPVVTKISPDHDKVTTSSQLTENVLPNTESKMMPVTPKAITNNKPPKRVQVITLLSDDSPNDANPKKDSTKLDLTSVCDKTSCSEKLSSPIMSPNNIRKHFSPIIPGNADKQMSNPLTSPKTPKRVTVTKISGTNSADNPSLNQLVSPNKVPKRVNVTTLVTFNNAKNEPNLAAKSVTPSKSAYTAVIPQSPPVSHADKNAVKQPKRITVQTLSTFTNATQSVVLEKEESPLTSIPVQVDPQPSSEDVLSNSFDAPLIETELNKSNTEACDTSISNDPDSSMTGSGKNKDDSIVID